MAAFTGRTALVTGAALGLGRAIALAFAGAGARVWCCDILAEGLDETRAMAVGELHTVVADVTDRGAVQAFAAQAVRDSGRVDILVNDAGGLCGQSFQPIEDLPETDWHTVLHANLTSAFLCIQAVTPSMKSAGYGRIVNIASGAGLTTTVTGIQAYASAKAGMIGLTRQVAQELGPHGVTVNCVAPGAIPCNPYGLGKWMALGEEGQRAALERLATRTVGKADDIANAVLFFAAEASNWVTGQTLLVDGGKRS
jgi:3-oxoacyl-[acyl-carrier protein] reductase